MSSFMDSLSSNKPRPLFLLGNKRSGTSHLVRLLNLHPRVFVTHESDVIWILYQITKGEILKSHPWDGPVGMEATLEACKNILDNHLANLKKGQGVQEAFLEIEHYLMKNGSSVQEPYDKTNLAWIGDKKPVQQADPEVRLFIHANFPHARFIHIVRHPQAVVASMIDAGKKWGRVAYWTESAAGVLERWAVHENWILNAKSEGHQILSLRLEDLYEDPLKVMTLVFKFLELETQPEIVEAVISKTSRNTNEKYSDFTIPRSAEANRIMAYYGYN
jgi:hypothetical protein